MHTMALRAVGTMLYTSTGGLRCGATGGRGTCNRLVARVDPGYESVGFVTVQCQRCKTMHTVNLADCGM